MFLLIVVILAGYFLYTRIWKVHNFWKDRGIICTKSWPPFGDMAPAILKKMSMPENVLNIYKKFPHEKYFGINQFMIPTLFIRDIDIIKRITIKDFDYFQDHRNFVDPEVDVLFGKNLMSLKGKEWRDMRATLSPAFTSSKMKSMFILMSECSEQFIKYFLNKGKNTITLEMKDTFTRFANDLIASIAFGIKCDSMAERENEFYVMGKEATTFTGFKNIIIFLAGICPSILRIFNLSIIPKEIEDFFRKIVKETIETREANGIIRHDMINLLMEAQKGRLKHEPDTKDDNDAGFATVEESSIGKQNVKLRKELSLDDLTAQALIFFFGGFDGTSSAMCFMGHELAANPKIQKKLQNEIDETWKKCNGKLTYEALLKMKYLDMVLSETLRKWPIGFMSDRVCVKPYTLQPTNLHEKPLHLETGCVIMIPWYGIHLDPQYFPSPNVFDPNRFSEENKSSILPGSYMPFGSGPRNCIGSRFAILETKVLFFHLLSKFDLVVVEKTQIPLILSKKQFNMLAENGFWVGFKPRNTMVVCKNAEDNP